MNLMKYEISSLKLVVDITTVCHVKIKSSVQRGHLRCGVR